MLDTTDASTAVIATATLVVLWVYYTAVAVVSSATLCDILPRHVKDIVILCAARGKLPGVPADRQRRSTILTALQAARVPHSWFLHFYIAGFIATSTLLWALSTAAAAGPPCHVSPAEAPPHQRALCGALLALPSAAVLAARGEREAGPGGGAPAVALFLAHTLRRLGECLCVNSSHPSARMHFGAYAFGISFYTLTPLALLASTAGWPTPHTSRMAPALSSSAAVPVDGGATALGDVAALAVRSWHVAVGAAVFAYGSWQQHQCHRLLGALRASSANYSMPRGGWFESVSSPHYAAEVVLYMGLVVTASGLRPSLMWMVLAAVASNLAVGAGMAHTWYQKQFKSYPRNRWALVPYIY